MPFLHGFRRIVYEYQPLVDAVMFIVGMDEDLRNNVCGTDEDRNVCQSLMELLEKESKSSVFMEGVSYCLFKVAELGKGSAAQLLLDYGADLNFEDPVSYYNPLHIAVLRNKPHIVQMLVEHGANIDKRDRVHGSSPLDLASEEGDRLSCLRVLLDLGADVNAKDKNGKTAVLHALASSDGLTANNANNIELLLEKGADVNATTHDGETPLSLLACLVKEALDSSVEDASLIGHFCIQVAGLLLDYDADPSSCLCKSGEVWEPCLTYISLTHFDLLFPLAALILQRGASFFCSRHTMSCWSGHKLIFTRLEEASNEPLHAAEVNDLLAKAQVLVELAQLSSPNVFRIPTNVALLVKRQDPILQPLLKMQDWLKEQEARPLPLRCLCRAFIRRTLLPWPLEDKVKTLPLPDRLKLYLLPDHSLIDKPGWDQFKPFSIR